MNLATMPRTSLLVLATIAPLAAQTQTLVVPQSATTTDATSHLWLAGASRDVRQQTLIGSSHLQPIQNRTITTLELRRSAANEQFTGGTANLTITLSTSPNNPLTATDAFATNLGIDATIVFRGAVTLPTSPATTGPNVAWTPENTIRIDLQQPFTYHGGTLLIDVTGTAISGQTADWWLADAEFEDVAGATAQIGTGCGTFGGNQGTWSFVDARSLQVGGHAHFHAVGPANGFAAIVFGQPAAQPIALTTWGIPAPGCFCHLDPTSILGAAIVPFVQDPHPALANWGGDADVRFAIPNVPSSLSLSLTTQWLDLSQPATSNAITWSVCGEMPTLDLALVEGHAAAAHGTVHVSHAHVWRLTAQ